MAFRRYGSYRHFYTPGGLVTPDTFLNPTCFGNLEYEWGGDLIGCTEEDARRISFIEAADEDTVAAIEEMIIGWHKKTLDSTKALAEDRGYTVTSGVTDTGTVELILEGGEEIDLDPLG